MKRKIKIGIICLAAIIIAILGVFRQWSLPATQTFCKGEDFYEKEVQSLGYQVLSNYVTISGCCISSSRNRARSESLDLYPGQEFYYTNTGKEQTVSVKLGKIESRKAYFLFNYGAAPPACETVGGCDYNCEFVKE